MARARSGNRTIGQTLLAALGSFLVVVGVTFALVWAGVCIVMLAQGQPVDLVGAAIVVVALLAVAALGWWIVRRSGGRMQTL